MTLGKTSYQRSDVAERRHAYRSQEGSFARVVQLPLPCGARGMIGGGQTNAHVPQPESGPLQLPITCRDCPLRFSRGLCADCGPEIAGLIASYKSGDRQLKTGQDLFGLGETCDSIYQITRGWVILYNILEDGRRQILHFALPGAVLGFHPARGAMMTYGAQALTETNVCVVPHKALAPIVKQQPEFGLRLARFVARDYCLALDRLTSVGRHSARERVAHLLLELFVRYRAQWPGSHIEEMILPLTQEHIGDATGLTFVHVNRVLSGLRKDGIVEFHYRRLRVRDPDKLVDAAAVDPQLVLSWLQ